MKNFPILICIMTLLAFQSCVKDKCEKEITYIKHTPIYKTAEEIRGDVTYDAPQALKNPGKIYFYNNYIFINEQREGIHIIDNQNPEAPSNIGFISIPGNVDMAIRNNILFADNYIDLLSIDIGDFNNIHLVKRTEEVFLKNMQQDNNTWLVDYHEEEVTEIVECNAAGEWIFSEDLAVLDASSAGNSGSSVPNSGIGGSMARFTLDSDHLYIVDEFSMMVFGVQDGSNPIQHNTIELGWGIETIIPYNQYLFIGSNSGMQIYDNTNPTSPAYISEVSHMTACDPVFVKDNFAYVTLRSGNICDGFVDQLDLVDISNITQPQIVKSFEMDNPHGLSIKDESLFLCEGEFGFKIFEITDAQNLDDHIEIKEHLKDIVSYDVIAIPGQQDIVLIIGDNGFYQYDVSDPTAPELVSSILAED